MLKRQHHKDKRDLDDEKNTTVSQHIREDKRRWHHEGWHTAEMSFYKQAKYCEMLTYLLVSNKFSIKSFHEICKTSIEIRSLTLNLIKETYSETCEIQNDGFLNKMICPWNVGVHGTGILPPLYVLSILGYNHAVHFSDLYLTKKNRDRSKIYIHKYTPKKRRIKTSFIILK